MVTAAPPSKVAGSPRSDDDKAGTPLAGLSCSCWVLHKPIEKSSAWGQKTPYYNRPTQDGLRRRSQKDGSTWARIEKPRVSRICLGRMSYGGGNRGNHA